ncbi:unnamed protein product [Phytophthora fragariaefolia]|uniref:Unnamed protein product n=1 Tax=Phytophthora fragariaefolia TaxID=1490495 RepID=A0A9W6Y045_9STRA|nr:unnamed protein product [Phytophthora fragariaefolia]
MVKLDSTNCDKKVMIEWIENDWAPYIQDPSILALDSLKTHKSECNQTRLVDYVYTSVVYVPPGATGLAQPTDIAVMKPFKDRLRDRYAKFVIENGTFFDTAQKRRHIAISVLQAWDESTTSPSVTGFKKPASWRWVPRMPEVSSQHQILLVNAPLRNRKGYQCRLVGC